jgi:hypothetical protein
VEISITAKAALALHKNKQYKEYVVDSYTDGYLRLGSKYSEQALAKESRAVPHSVVTRSDSDNSGLLAADGGNAMVVDEVVESEVDSENEDVEVAADDSGEADAFDPEDYNANAYEVDSYEYSSEDSKSDGETDDDASSRPNSDDES